MIIHLKWKIYIKKLIWLETSEMIEGQREIRQQI